MILTDRRSQAVFQWARAEVIRLVGRGPWDERGIVAAVLGANPWGTAADPWSEETAAAVARRAAIATLASLQGRRPCPRNRQLPLGLALLVGSLALWGALRVGP